MKSITSVALALVLAAGMSGQALAHAKLVKSNPPENGQPSNRQNLSLTFSEVISDKLSGADVTDAAGHAIPSAVMADQGGKGLMVMLKEPLKPGAYKLDWHAVASDDGHRTTGTVAFSVK